MSAIFRFVAALRERPAIKALARSRPIKNLALGGIVLVGAIAVSAALAAWHFRANALSDTDRELQNLALTVAQHVDQQLQGVELGSKLINLSSLTIRS